MLLSAPPVPKPRRKPFDWQTLIVPVLVALLGSGGCAGVYQVAAASHETNRRLERIETVLSTNREDDLKERAEIRARTGLLEQKVAALRSNARGDQEVRDSSAKKVD